MAEINNQRKAFLDMLAWSEESRMTPETEIAVVQQAELFTALPSPGKLVTLKKTQNSTNRRRTLPASFPLVGCLPQAAWPEDSLRKSGRCGIAAALRSVALYL